MSFIDGFMDRGPTVHGRSLFATLMRTIGPNARASGTAGADDGGGAAADLVTDLVSTWVLVSPDVTGDSSIGMEDTHDAAASGTAKAARAAALVAASATAAALVAASAQREAELLQGDLVDVTVNEMGGRQFEVRLPDSSDVSEVKVRLERAGAAPVGRQALFVGGEADECRDGAVVSQLFPDGGVVPRVLFLLVRTKWVRFQG